MDKGPRRHIFESFSITKGMALIVSDLVCPSRLGHRSPYECQLIDFGYMEKPTPAAKQNICANQRKFHTDINHVGEFLSTVIGDKC